jgi:Glycosyl hydrolase catalytic core
VFGRPAPRLVIALALALLGALPGSAAADVGPSGWGISDEYHVPTITLDDTYDELAPSTFRLMVIWDRIGDPAYLTQIQNRLAEGAAAARGSGDIDIAVTFTVPPQTWQGVTLTPQAWFDQIKPVIDRFTPYVDWWGPMNEPGLKGWTFTPAGATFLANASVLLKNYLDSAHPDDKLLSPDFNDHYNSDGTLKRHTDGTSFVERYVKLFDKAGGQFGSAVAWHPYGAVRRKSFLSTDDLVYTLSGTKGAGLPIWVTEAGAHVDDQYVPGQTEAQQDDQVRWLTDTTSGLASHDAIWRINYYDMRQQYDITSPTCQEPPGFPWDTGLVRVCGDPRPAWYTWCRASRQNDAACYDNSPGAASWSIYRLDVFFRGSGDDQAVYRRSWDTNGPWTSASSMGGATTSGTGAAAVASKRLDIVTRGLTDNFVWNRRYDGSTWTGWTNLGGKTYSSPATSARRGTSILDVFMRGTDNAIYHRYRNGTTWSSGWASIGAPPGGATSAPASVSNNTGKIDVFVRGADTAIWRNTWTTAWSGWARIGGSATSAPSVTSRGTNRLDLFTRGQNGQIYRTYNDGGGWSAWTSLGGGTLSAPAAVASSSNRIDLWARGTTGALQHDVWGSATGWSGWNTTWLAGPRP